MNQGGLRLAQTTIGITLIRVHIPLTCFTNYVCRSWPEDGMERSFRHELASGPSGDENKAIARNMTPIRMPKINPSTAVRQSTPARTKIAATKRNLNVVIVFYTLRLVITQPPYPTSHKQYSLETSQDRHKHGSLPKTRLEFALFGACQVGKNGKLVTQ